MFLFGLNSEYWVVVSGHEDRGKKMPMANLCSLAVLWVMDLHGMVHQRPQACHYRTCHRWSPVTLT